MRYQVRVAGRIFEGTDVNALLKCAVRARKEMLKTAAGSMNEETPSPHLGPRLVHSRREMHVA